MADFITDELSRLNKYLDKDMKIITNAASRAAMGRAGNAMLKEAKNVIRSKTAIKAAGANKQFKKVVKKKGSIPKHAAIIFIKDRKLDLIDFLIGSPKKIVDQKGVAVKDRKILKVRIKKGRKPVKVRTGFIQKSIKGDGLQIFKRRKDGGWYKQSVPSLHRMFDLRKNRMPVMEAGVNTYNKRFRHELDARIKKLANRQPKTIKTQKAKLKAGLL